MAQRCTWAALGGDGQRLALSFGASLDAGASIIITDILACGTAGCGAIQMSSYYPSPVFAPTGNNPTTVAARLQFATPTGAVVYLIIPAVNASCFLSDGETINPSATEVAYLIADCISYLTDQGGNAVSTYVAGHKIILPTPPFNLG